MSPGAVPATNPGAVATRAPTASPEFFATLNGFLVGELSRFQAGLCGADDPRPHIAQDALLGPGDVAAIVARFDARFGRTDRRAVMSMWASAYFTDTVPPLLAANILLDLAPRLGPGEVSFVMAPSLRIQALRIGAELVSLAGIDAGARFTALIGAHLAALIAHVATRGGVTRRVLWSNVGNVFEAFLRKLEAIDAGRPGLAHARALLASPMLDSGERNPLFEPVRYLDGRRVRRVCCMRYLVPNEVVCGVCPLGRASPARRVGETP